MIVKNVETGTVAREKLIKGVNIIANAVGSTLGAQGRTVLMESEHHTAGIIVTKDGVSVSKGINLLDPTENLAVMIMREASEKTANSAGDGTTTSMVLAQAIIHAAMGTLTKEDNTTQVLRDVQSAALKVAQELTAMSTEITSDKLVDVATISANGDIEIGKIIADAYNQVGLSGVVTVESSATAETYAEVISGMKIDRGFASKYFVTDHKKQEAVMDKPYILVTDQPVTNINDILPILEFIHHGRGSLIIIGELDENALNTLNVNKIKSGLKVCTIIPPSFGYKRHQIMQDIAIATGAKYFSEQTGDNLLMATIDDCGRASKVVSSRFNTIIFDAEGAGDERVQELHEQLDVETQPTEKEFLKERIANLGGGVGVIKVGANSDIEQKEKKDRVDDAVCAVRAALEEGILPGGGVALKDIAANLVVDNKGTEILQMAMLSPMIKILSNAGIDVDGRDFDENKQLAQEGIGINVATGAYCHMMSVGIIDPTKVTKEALKNAVSVATTLLSTETVITNIRA
jgi:chaperonin GroEL